MKNLATLLTTIFLLSCNNKTTNEQTGNTQTMTNDADQLLKEIRVDKLESTDTFVFEIDLADKRISKTSPLLSDNSDLKQLQDRLPPSYLKFIKTFSNGLRLDEYGIYILPVGQVTGFWTDVLSLTNEVSDSFTHSRDFVIFGMTGIDSDMFAFYTAKKFDNGEYPIVWFTPGSADTKPFVLLNSGFDKFLTMQYYLFKATDYEDTYATSEEAAKVSSDKNYITYWQNFKDKLYDTFDPTIPKLNHDYYKSAISLTELNETIERTKNNSR